MSEHHHIPHDEQELKQALEEHDSWFRHDPDEPHHQDSHGDFNPAIVMGFLGATIVGTLGVAIILFPWFTRSIQNLALEQREQNPGILQEQIGRVAEWDAALRGEPRWLDEQANIIAIPIDIAMDQVVQWYNN
mgnify:CR=1 FL=1